VLNGHDRTRNGLGGRGPRVQPNGFLPYDPAYNEEIQASIEEYIGSR